jgi:hypothetical protein
MAEAFAAARDPGGEACEGMVPTNALDIVGDVRE